MNRASLFQSNMLILSMAHVSPISQTWIERHAEKLGIFENGEGFVFSPEDIVAKIGPDDIPQDVLQIGAFAKANGFGRVCAECDAPEVEALPVYEQMEIDRDLNRISKSGKLAEVHKVETTAVMHPARDMIEHVPLAAEHLALDPGVTNLEDADYEATDDGLWIGIKEASIRVHSDKYGVNVDILARGCEDEEPLGSAQADHCNLRDMIEERKRASEEVEGPEM